MQLNKKIEHLVAYVVAFCIDGLYVFRRSLYSFFAYSRQNGFYCLLAENQQSGQYADSISTQTIAPCIIFGTTIDLPRSLFIS